MNTINANQTLGFDKFSECDYNLHWSFSNFNRILMAAGQIARLPKEAKVLELGAGTSDVENLVKKNFKRDDIRFVKIDGDKQYETREDNDSSIVVMDITSEECYRFCYNEGRFDAIIFMEVIEHLNKDKIPEIIDGIYDWLKPEGMLLFTTPTPPCGGCYEDRVWPLDHDFEFSYWEVYSLLNRNFKIVKEIGWSLEEREYNHILERDPQISRIYSKLKGAFPESYIRAFIACLVPVDENRQVFFVCKKRRYQNGRSS